MTADALRYIGRSLAPGFAWGIAFAVTATLLDLI